MNHRKAKDIPDQIRPKIHIDLLPRLNELLLQPFTLVLLTFSLIPLARYLDHGGASGMVKDNDDPERAEYDRKRWRAFAIALLAAPTLLGMMDYLGKLEIRPWLDLWAFASYGALHFASPIIMGWWCWGFNICGLATHLAFPNAAPWFYDLFGADAAQPDYSYLGNPAGLIRVDAILGTSNAATSVCAGLFIARYSKGYRGLAFMVFYCSWMFWATMYLHHHFAIDLVVGSAYSITTFFIADRIRLRQIDAEHERRGLTNGSSSNASDLSGASGMVRYQVVPGEEGEEHEKMVERFEAKADEKV
ncbi:hypothetical protein MNV49_007050 [Pseudohyphozyma bogoriensis]|nr:hypothetical protein MNV49_007050 [Pseudohyphozyma bogoriensis]